MLERLLERGAFRKTISLPRRRHRLHVMPTSVGFERAEGPGYDWDGRRRGAMPFAVLQHTVAGEGRLAYEGTLRRVRPNETMLITVPHGHRYWLQRGEAWDFFWIAMCGQEALRLLRAILAAAGPILHLRPDSIERLAAACLAMSDLSGDAAGQASGLGYAAVMVLYDDVLGRPDAAQSAGSHSAVARAVAHIRAHLEAPLDVPTLAALAGCSRAHFSRLFTAVQGVPPSEFVMAERMGRAARLLGDHALKVKAIAQACGYDDANYFAKAFRTAYGLSPTEFRSTGMYAAPLRRPVP